MKNLLDENGAEEEDIVVPNIEPLIFTKIITFLEHYIDHEFPQICKPLKSQNLIENGATEWEANFV